MAKYMKVVNHKKGKVDLTSLGTNIGEYYPTELHYKSDGAIGDKPSFTIVMREPNGSSVYGQFSLDTLNECLKELGYKSIK